MFAPYRCPKDIYSCEHNLQRLIWVWCRAGWLSTKKAINLCSYADHRGNTADSCSHFPRFNIFALCSLPTAIRCFLDNREFKNPLDGFVIRSIVGSESSLEYFSKSLVVMPETALCAKPLKGLPIVSIKVFIAPLTGVDVTAFIPSAMLSLYLATRAKHDTFDPAPPPIIKSKSE